MRPPATVTVAAAVAEDVPIYLDEIGRTTAFETVSIRPQVSGPIVAIHFADGAQVETGALLFTIDPRPYEALVAEAEAQLAHDRAIHELAESEFLRVESLGDVRAVSKQELDARRNAVAVASARVEAGAARVEIARVDLDRCTIRSPIDGRAGKKLVDLGNVVDDGGDTSLLVIQKLDPIYADFTVAEGDLPAVRENLAGGTLTVEIRSPGQASAVQRVSGAARTSDGVEPEPRHGDDASLPQNGSVATSRRNGVLEDGSSTEPGSAGRREVGDPSEPRRGDVTFIDTMVREATGTVPMRATLSNADRRFWPGQFIEVRLILRTLAGAVLVPVQAVQKSQQGPFVYVVRDDASAELRQVVTGQRHGERIVVEEGVLPGEKVITTGQIAVAPGGQVRIVDATQPP